MSCLDVSALNTYQVGNPVIPTLNNSILAIPNVNSSATCNAVCGSATILAQYPNITYSSEVAIGTTSLECLCLAGVNATILSGLPSSSACVPCNSTSATAGDLGICGVENANTGFVSAAYITPVVNPCVDLTPLGPAVDNITATFQNPFSLGGAIYRNSSVNSSVACNTFCTSLSTTYPNITFSSELQNGGSTECACLALNITQLTSLKPSGACLPCFAPYAVTATPADLGTCGFENYTNGYVSAAYLQPVVSAYTTATPTNTVITVPLYGSSTAASAQSSAASSAASYAAASSAPVVSYANNSTNVTTSTTLPLYSAPLTSVAAAGTSHADASTSTSKSAGSMVKPGMGFVLVLALAGLGVAQL